MDSEGGACAPWTIFWRSHCIVIARGRANSRPADYDVIMLERRMPGKAHSATINRSFQQRIGPESDAPVPASDISVPPATMPGLRGFARSDSRASSHMREGDFR